MLRSTDIDKNRRFTNLSLFASFVIPEFNRVPCSDFARAITVFPESCNKELGRCGDGRGLYVFMMACCLINEPVGQHYRYLAILE
jgi:hypothetical protein